MCAEDLPEKFLEPERPTNRAQSIYGNKEMGEQADIVADQQNGAGMRSQFLQGIEVAENPRKLIGKDLTSLGLEYHQHTIRTFLKPT